MVGKKNIANQLSIVVDAGKLALSKCKWLCQDALIKYEKIDCVNNGSQLQIREASLEVNRIVDVNVLEPVLMVRNVMAIHENAILLKAMKSLFGRDKYEDENTFDNYISWYKKEVNLKLVFKLRKCQNRS